MMPGKPSLQSRYFLFAVLTSAIFMAVQPAQAQTTAEEKKSLGVYQIKADTIHALGVTGKNVTIAVVDTGVMSAHTEFSLRLLTGYNAFDGSANALDDNGHGTHVAGISAAGKNNPSTSGMFGVAYESYIMPIKVLNNRGSGTSTSVAQGIQYAVDQRNSLSLAEQFKPFVMNLSLGSSAPSTVIETALKNAVSSGMAVAAAAGNDGGLNPGWPARFAKETWANGQILAVGAVDATNKIASFSNRAGDTKDFYLVAPGISVYSTYTKLNRKTRKYDATYATLSGTSMATPFVTGAIALVKSGWSHLSAAQINAILLNSATDLGAAGVDDVYGHGLLNLQAALSPLGALNFATASDGQTVSSSGTQITSGGALGSLGGLSEKLEGLVVHDSYMREFPIVTSALISTQGSGDDISAATLQVMGLTSAGQRQLVGIDSDTWLSFSGNPREDSGWSYGFSDQGTFIGFGAGDGAALSFSDARWGDGQNAFAYTDTSASGALLDLVDDGVYTAAGFDLGENARVSFGAVTSVPGDMMEDTVSDAQGVAAAYTFKASDDMKISLSSSFLEESDTLLGTSSGGALELGSSSASVSFGAGTHINLASGWMLGFDAAYALTNPDDSAASLVGDISTLASQSYTLGLTNANLTGIGDTMGISVSKPLRVSSGSASLTVPVGTDDNGSPIVEHTRVSLASDGSETDVNFIYRRPLGDSMTGELNFAYRDDADNISGARDAAAMYRFRMGF